MKRTRYLNPWYFALLFTLLYSAFTFYLFYTLHPEGTPRDPQTFFFGMGTGLVTLLAVYLSYRLIKKKEAAMNNGFFYLLLFALSGVLFLLLYNLFWAWLVRGVLYHVPTSTALILTQSKVMLGVLFAPISIASILGLYNEKVFRLNQDILLREKMLSEARLTQLQQQVDPHFLFNNLNILTVLIQQSPEQATVFTQRLSQLYRYYLRSGKHALSSLREELQYAQDYLYLLECRFGAAFRLQLAQKEDVLEDDLFLAAGTLQLLLENVVKHNAASIQQPVTVTITITHEHLIAENELRPREALSEGTGLKNLEDRYRILSGQPIHYGVEDKVFRVTIPLVKKMTL